MNTAFVDTHSAAPIAPVASSSALRRPARRLGAALVAWTAARRASRRAVIDPADLHELQRAAAQLREDRFRDVAVGRLL